MLAPPVLDGSAPLLGFNTYPQPLPFTPSTSFSLNRQQPPPPPPPVRDLPPPPPRIEHASCNYLILENFDEAAVKDKNVQMRIIFGRKFPKAPPGDGGRDEAIEFGAGLTGLGGGGAGESASASATGSGSGSASQSANTH
ncbi:YL1 nuclear protein [Diplocarpon rosae]|nr:YL1 nuclear protein [Diplocarpon rosae]